MIAARVNSMLERLCSFVKIGECLSFAMHPREY